ncbi:MAG TPA: hypothetical protein VMR45_02545 [Patescibacteria group bacterium]|nr:hypothetical protein [Patescibacteria group bacterium]
METITPNKHLLHESVFSPEEIPTIDIPFAQQRLVDAYRAQALKTADTWQPIADFCASHQGTIRENRAKILHNDSVDGTPGRYAGIVCIPITSDSESIDEMTPTLASIVASANEENRPTLIVPWLNYIVSDYRHKRPDRTRQMERALIMSARIESVVRELGSSAANVEIATAIDEQPEGSPHMSRVRNNALLGMVGLLGDYWLGDSKTGRTFDPSSVSQKYFHNLPLVWCDADTVLSTDALPKIYRDIREDQGLIISGEIRYVGGVMDYSQEQLAHSSPNQRLTYITEILRRIMLQHLQPEQPRGYLPETGMAIKLGVLVGLEGFCQDAQTSESYWVLHAAKKALEPWYDLKNYRILSRSLSRHPYRGNPHINEGVARALRAFVWYDDYHIDTSIRGTEQMVRRYGRNTLIEFDQGSHYAMWADGQLVDPPIQESAISEDELRLQLNSTFSYFKLCGGQLLAEDLGGLNGLLDRIMPLAYGQLWRWFPETLLREKWPIVQ